MNKALTLSEKVQSSFTISGAGAQALIWRYTLSFASSPFRKEGYI
jgi:hypothetical protein